MDTTFPRNYPYPECDPPLTKDASDIVHVRNLAEAINADVTNLFNTIDNNLLTPDGCHIGDTVSQTINQGDALAFNVNRFDNSPGSTMNHSNGILIRTDGTYLVTGWVRAAVGALTNFRSTIIVSGSGELLHEGLAVDFNASVGAGSTGTCVLRLNAGRLIQLSARATGTATVTIALAELACVRIGPR